MRDNIREENQEISPEPELSGPLRDHSRERLFWTLFIAMAIVGAILGGFIAYHSFVGKPCSKVWVGIGLGFPAEVAGALGAALLRRITIRRSVLNFEELLRLAAPGAFLGGFMALGVWLLMWPEEMATGPMVDMIALIFGTLAGAMGGVGLLVMALVCICD